MTTSIQAPETADPSNRPTFNVGFLRIRVHPGQTVNDLVADALLRASWRDESTPLLAFVLSDVDDFAGFAAAVGPAWNAAGRPDPAVLFPSSITIDGQTYESVSVPTMHAFAITREAARPLMMAARSDCPKTLMRLLGLNKNITPVAVPCDPPKAGIAIHNFRPSVSTSQGEP